MPLHLSQQMLLMLALELFQASVSMDETYPSLTLLTHQPRERSFATNEKEALAYIWACETWEKYLAGRPFTLRTDHAALASLLQRTTDTRKSAKFTRSHACWKDCQLLTTTLSTTMAHAIL
ncbi:retrovirus-related Pol polyprotein from transposon 17.6 [Elysia marginata]|uniref:Retrovirus-related Pol polyprotein from transposon 17.6 n=1 Tax=Elysia marginata TaxID=1093978 RepID=A0AAV4IP36_9GAST|nr:retrovirus-related Pol polyprotein from transposon 17.6 [Elysia marginata]